MKSNVLEMLIYNIFCFVFEYTIERRNIQENKTGLNGILGIGYCISLQILHIISVGVIINFDKIKVLMC